MYLERLTGYIFLPEDTIIQKIVELLQKVGDQWEEEVRSKGGRDGLGVWDWHVHTLRYTERLPNGDLLCSTGNSTQYSVIIYVEKESERE